MAQLTKREIENEDLRTKVSQLETEIEELKKKTAEMERLRAELQVLKSGEERREAERLRSELERLKASEERIRREFDGLRSRLEDAEKRLEQYSQVMSTSDKTKAFLMIEDTGSMALREIARALGVSPAQVQKWAEDFEAIGVAKVVEGDKVVYAAQEEPAPEDLGE